jgi:xanthine dehydrogenase accessory factor
MGIFQTLLELEREGKPAALVTVIRTQGSVPRHAGSKMIVFADGSCEGTIGGGAMESQVIERALLAIQENENEVLSYKFQDPERGDVGVCGGEMEVFVEPIKPSPTVIVIGAGHVGREVADLATWLGFQVLLSDDRQQIANSLEQSKEIEVHRGSMDELPFQRNIHGETYFVLTTRDVTIDVAGLPSLLDTPAGYFGVIGSKRRWETTRELLLEKGVPESAISRVHSPMGLEIHAETPREIALSVMAQIVAIRNKTEQAAT